MSQPGDPTYGVYLGDLDRRRTDSQGIISYSVGLTRAVASAIATDERLVVFASPQVKNELGALRSAGTVEIVDVEPARSAGARLYREQLGIAAMVASAGVDVVHFPKGRAPWHRDGSRSKVVATIHDDIPMQYLKGAFGGGRKTKYAYVAASLRRTLRTADTVLCDSVFTQHQLERVGRRRAPIRVVVPGLGLDARHKALPERTHSRLLVFDSPFTHKRSDEAAIFAARYLFERRLSDHRVVLLGEGRASRLVGTLDRVVRHGAGPLDHDELADLVRSSRAVVSASRYEGLGLPVLEAWALGTPAVVADSEAAREMLGDIGCVYRAGDYRSFAESLDAALSSTSDARRERSRAVLERCDWSRAGKAVVDVYRELAS